MASYDDTATVSGSVVSFPNGADDVPTKSLVVTIPPTLTGVSALTETQTGKNLLDTAIAETKSNNSVSITCDGNGKYTATGTATGGSANVTFTLKTPCTIKSGMYLHLMNSGATGSVAITLQKQDNTSIYAPALSPANRIADLSSYAGQTIYSIRFYVVNGASFEMTLTPMVCFSSTATTFEPYQTPTQYTASLGRTIYGGTPDVVKGEGKENCTNRNLVGEGFTWSYNTTEFSFPYFTIGSNAPDKASNKNFVCEGYVNNGNYRSNLQDGEIGVFNNTAGINRFCVRDDSCTTLEQFLEKNANTKITYEVTTPTDFTFEPVEINTRLGNNTMWSEQGDTELTYYKSGYGFTSVTVNKTGKNLIDGTKFTRGLPSTTIGASIDTIATSNRYAYYGVRAGGGSLTVSSTSSDTDYFTLVLIWGYKNGVLTYYSNTQAGTSKTVDFSNCDYVRIGIGAISGKTVPTDLTGYGTIQLELGSQATSYEPYEAISKTAKFHKIVYEGEVDAVRGIGEVSIGESGTEYDPPETFTFPPISMETDEGENTLFANEGASAITYRKAVD